MKYFLILFLLLPSFLLAGAKVEYRTGDWELVVFKDDFTDKVSCALYTKNAKTRGKPGIILFAKHDVSGNHVILYANGGIDGIGITYRVDKNSTVTFGDKYYFQTEDDSYIVHNPEYGKIVKDFKVGNSVVYAVHSGNQFVDDAREKISLKGFTKIYNMAEKCNH